MRDAASSNRLTTFLGGFSVTFWSTGTRDQTGSAPVRPAVGPCSGPNARQKVEDGPVEQRRRLEVEAVAAARNLHQLRPRDVLCEEIGVGRRDQAVRIP